MVAYFSTLLEGEKPLSDEQMKAKIQEVFGIEEEQSAELLTIIKSFKGINLIHLNLKNNLKVL